MLTFGRQLDVGIKRKGKPNQDALAIVNPRSAQPLLIIADGMGGYEGGAVASQIVIDTLRKAYKQRKRKKTDRPGLLSEAILAAHRVIVARAQKSENFASMGSTVVAAAIDEKNDQALVVNVGDSRAYLITKQAIQVVSHDHSEVADLERTGALTALQARDYRRKNVLTMSLTASRPESTIQPYSDMVNFPPGAVLLLCSDGLWGVVPGSVIQAMALEYPPQKAAQKLVELANASGGPDNISVLIARRRGEWRQYKRENSLDMEDTFSGVKKDE